MFISGWYEQRRLQVLAQEAVGQRILDLGYAQLPNHFLAERDGLHITGLDLSPPPADHPYHETLQGDATALDTLLGDRRFDTVIAGEFIEHLEEPYAFLRSVRRIIAPGGQLVLSTPNPMGFPTVFAELFHDQKHFYTEDHTFYFLPRWVERLLERTGYELIKKRSVGLWTPFIKVPWAPIALSYQVVYVARLSS